MKGFFVSIEGNDGSGKSTVIKEISNLIRKSFPKLNFIFVREPGSTNVGEKIRKILLSHSNDMSVVTEAYLFAASRAELVSQKIEPYLKKNYLVISDRYLDSSIVYQGIVKNIGVQNILDLNKLAINKIKPNITFWLSVDFEVANKRLVSKRKKKMDRLDVWQKNKKISSLIHNGYETLLSLNNKRIIKIFADKNISTVIDNIWKILKSKIIKHYKF